MPMFSLAVPPVLRVVSSLGFHRGAVGRELVEGARATVVEANEAIVHHGAPGFIDGSQSEG